jgi:hypothetical protein
MFKKNKDTKKIILDFIRNNGGYWFGHLPIIQPSIVKLEDFLNNKGRPTSKWRTDLVEIIHLATGNTIYYLDYVNGNDANNGTTWALAWKTFVLGATAARIAPGDVIRVAKSPVPTSMGQNATWTNMSRTVTLTSAVTAVIEDCEDAWTASANVTDSSSTTNKEGTNSRSFAIAAGFTTGKIAYEGIGTINFSAYQQVSFWIRANAAVAAGVLTLNLCSDTIGAVSVNSIAIPAIPGTNTWQQVTVDTGGALGVSIQSVSLNAASDPGTVTILIDNIIACKASSSADSLTLSSLISKNSSVQGGSEGWYGIQSINGTTITLDAGVGTDAGVGQGYSGTTEAVTLYKRECIPFVATGTTTTPMVTSMDSGTSGSMIEFQGGYDTGSTTQDGETFFDGKNGNGYGIHLTGKSFVKFNWFSVVRAQRGIVFESASNNNIIDNCSNISNMTSVGMFLTASYNNTFNWLGNVNNNSSSGISNSVASNNSYILVGSASNNTGGSGINIGGGSENTFFDVISKANNNAQSGVLINSDHCIINEITEAKDNDSSYGLYLNTCSNNIIRKLTTSGNATAGIANDYGRNYIYDASIAEATEVGNMANFASGELYSENHDLGGFSKIFTDGGIIESQNSTLTNGSGIEWKFTTQTTTNRTSLYPLRLVIAKIACSANNLVTVKAWFKKGHATNIGAMLVCKGDQIAGVTNDVTATKANDTNEEELAITFTPTVAGIVEIEAQAYYIAGHSTVIVDALTVTQA